MKHPRTTTDAFVIMGRFWSGEAMVMAKYDDRRVARIMLKHFKSRPHEGWTHWLTVKRTKLEK